MPILPLEPTVFPKALLENCTNDDQGRTWWAIGTKSRQEKCLARQLLASEVPFYLPLVPSHRRVRGRRVCSHLPLFTGYLFFFGNDDERMVAIKTNRILQMLPVLDRDRLVGDLRQVQRLIESNVPMTVESRLAVGDRVRVKSGAFMGFEGAILRRQGKSRLLLAVNCLQQGVSVEIEDFMVEGI